MGLLTRGHGAATSAVRAMLVRTAPHAVLVSGASGVGKTTLALDLAAGLLCEAADPAARPCRECRGCRLVERGVHADLHRIAPGGAGNQIRIGDRRDPEPGTIRRLVADLALLPVEGGSRVAIVERADRMNEDAQSALLKTLEEPPSGVTIVLCADREDQLLPTVRSRCIRLRLGPVPTRDVEAILGDLDIADAPTAARLARLSAGRPGVARAWALAPEAVTTRGEIGRGLLDLTSAGAARRLSVGRELLGRASEILRGLDRAERPAAPAPASGRGQRSRRAAAGAGVSPLPAQAAAIATDMAAASRAEQVDGQGSDDEGDAGRDLRVPAAERRRAAATFVEIWRDVTRDLLLVGLGEERRLRDPGLLDELRARADVSATALGAFLVRLDDASELIESNVSPELAVDVLLLAWPRASEAA